MLDDPNTPPAVRATVLAFLAQIDADERRYAPRHLWSPSVYARRDVRLQRQHRPRPRRRSTSAASTSSWRPDSQETSDWAGVMNAGIAHTYNPDRRFDWRRDPGQLRLAERAGRLLPGLLRRDRLQPGRAHRAHGPAWIVPGRWRAYVGLQADQIFLGGENLALFTSLNPGHRLAARRRLGGRPRRLHQTGTTGTTRRAAGTATNRQRHRRPLLPRAQPAVQAGVSYYNFDADDGSLQLRRAGGLRRRHRRGLDATARSSPASATAGTTSTASSRSSTSPRDDDELAPPPASSTTSARAGSTAGRCSAPGSTPTTSPNVPIYEYDRHDVSLGLSRSF